VAQCGFAARFKTEGGLAKNIGRDGLNHGIGPFVLGVSTGAGAGGSIGRERIPVRDPSGFRGGSYLCSIYRNVRLIMGQCTASTPRAGENGRC
jgi:hypothetical protein